MIGIALGMILYENDVANVSSFFFFNLAKFAKSSLVLPIREICFFPPETEKWGLMAMEVSPKNLTKAPVYRAL